MAENERILLVGEAPPDRGSLRAQIESLGYALEVAAGPAEALAAVETERFQLVVIDATADGSDGLRTAKHIKKMTREKAVPVMFACEATDLRTEVEGRDLGADDCFRTPVETEALGARIRLLLRNRSLELSLRERHRQCDLLNRDLLRARERLDRELDLARGIQRGLLPRRMGAEIPGYELAAALRPSGPVSGDFYDIHRLDETHWGFYVADAIGHGVPAALLTVFVKMGLRTREITRRGYRLMSPGEALVQLNRDMIAHKFSSNPFVTLFYAIIDTRTHVLRYASGGHPPAVVLTADGATVPLLSDGALLGVFESEFTTGERVIAKGESVILYTDGIEQARSKSGRTGLDAAIEYVRGGPPAESPEEFREAFAAHVEHALDALLDETAPSAARDDAALLVLRRLP